MRNSPLKFNVNRKNHMTKAQKTTNRLKQIWSNTDSTNWDSLEEALRSAKKLIDNGELDSDLVSTYLTIYEAFQNEFGGKK